MTLEVKLPIISWILALLLLTTSAAPNTNIGDFFSSLHHFNQNLFSELLSCNSSKNIIYSPFSIHSSLTMTRLGAIGDTAAEIDDVLGFTGQTPESVGDNYHALLARYEDSQVLKMANKMYVQKDYDLQDEYQNLITKKFFSSAEKIDFKNCEKAARTINTWVENKTNHKIKELIAADSLDENVHFLLLSAVHFNGQWAKAFPKENTSKRDFHLDESNTVQMEMMYRTGEFEYGIDRDLNANVLRLPYQDSDLSMIILIPRTRFGLTELEKKLKQFDFQSWKEKPIYWPNECCVYLPKFKAEYEIELKNPLMKMGMNRMFIDADFGNMLKSSKNLCVSNVVHKATIEVNEEGTEASAATDVEGMNRMESIMVNIDQPFAYAIITNDFIPLFQGTFLG